MDGNITVRPLESLDEFRACHGVQKEAWDFPDLLIIPYTQLVAAHHHGGVVLGAFDGAQLVGFVYGYLARQAGGPLYLFSQRMGVSPGYQGRGIGERLKWAQRAWALEQGLERIVWTYDPLETANARLNITKLGGIVRRYQRDVYGQHDTPLHNQLPSDRFVVEWELQSDRVRTRLLSGRPAPAPDDLRAQAGPSLNEVSWDERGLPHSAPPELEQERPLLRVRVPAEWQKLRRADMALARDWRDKTRSLFEHYLERGYAVTGYASGAENALRCNEYWMERDR